MIALMLAATVTMPTCDNAEDCTVKWGRAIRWVMEHNPGLVQQSETLVVTNEPLGKTHKYQVTRIPDGDGRATIVMTMACVALRKCPRDAQKADFHDAVMGLKP